MGRFNSFEHPDDWPEVQAKAENQGNRRRAVKQVLQSAVTASQPKKPDRYIKTREGEVIEVYEN